MLAAKSYNYNPLDDIECLFANQPHTLERRSSHETVVEISGKWDNMLLFFIWEEEMNCLHISCLMNLKPEGVGQPNIFELLALINEDIWVGYFSYWEEMQMPVFKHSLFIDKDEFNFTGKLSQTVSIALTECERAYPIFHAVFKQNIPPRKALLPLTLM